MITYFCHFGDGQVGEKFKHIIFGNIKLIPLLESKFLKPEFPKMEYDILIKYFLDGKITQFNDVIDKELIIDKKNKVIVINRRIMLNQKFSLIESYNYIFESTLEALKLFENKVTTVNSSNYLFDLRLLVTDVFNEVYLSNVNISE